MRSKPVILRIDTLLFVHGGIALACAERHLDIDTVNTIARRALFDFQQGQTDSATRSIFGSGGPLWYRGYFSSATNPSDIQRALSLYKAKNVIVGHPIVDSVTIMKDGVVFAIDVTFKNPAKIEGLLIENG